MRLLVYTQKVDRNDSILGFFHDWIVKMSEKFESVTVICLQKGQFDFAKNVTVYSLGKENGVSKLGYIINFYKYLHLTNGSYDKVFIHMNQEYVLLGGLYWRIKKIPIYLWRNHPNGGLLTYLSVMFSTKVFCTSTKSFTSRFKKTKVMPTGINTDVFKQQNGLIKKKYSVCMVGRISPVKHIELALESISILVKEGVQVSISMIGDVPQIDRNYFEKLKNYIEVNKLSNVVSFIPGVPPSKLPEVYSGFELCLNITEAGSFDKTIVESASCSVIPLVTNSSFKGLLPDVCITDTDPKNIADSIKKLLDPTEQIKIQDDLKRFVESQSLTSLMTKLSQEIK